MCHVMQCCKYERILSESDIYFLIYLQCKNLFVCGFCYGHLLFLVYIKGKIPMIIELCHRKPVLAIYAINNGADKPAHLN